MESANLCVVPNAANGAETTTEIEGIDDNEAVNALLGKEEPSAFDDEADAELIEAARLKKRKLKGFNVKAEVAYAKKQKLEKEAALAAKSSAKTA